MEFPLTSIPRAVSRMLAEIIKPNRILDHNSKFSLGPNKIISTTNQQEVSWKTTSTFPKKWIMDVCLCLECWLQVVMINGQEKS